MKPWSRATRFAFRFAFIYFTVYLLPFPLGQIPELEFIAERYNALWNRAVPWVGSNILRMDKLITDLPGGSGDTTFNYVQLFCLAVIALFAASVWSIIDRQRSAYPCLLDWLRIYVRFALGVAMFDYGVAKVINSQFPYPDLDRFIQPIGHASPMGLLWTFMGASPAYCVFTGLAECVGGLMRFWRRTVTAGALIIVGVMINVVMLNFCYDVPVKLYSSHLLFMAVFLLLPDVRRIADFLFLNRPTVPQNLGRPFANRWLNYAAVALKTLVVGYIVVLSVGNTREMNIKYSLSAPRPPLYGLYDVESFAQGGEADPTPADADKRWKRVVVNRAGRLAVQLMDDSVQRFQAVDNASEGKLELTPRWEPAKKAVIGYRKEDDNRLILEGDFFGDNLQITLRRVHDPQFLLVNRGFHWVNESPFNR